MISQTAEYGLRAIAYLAEHYGEPCTSHDIAKNTFVPHDYISKVLKGLVDAGMISSQRGLYGGFRLERPPMELPIIDIINAISPLQRIHDCPLGKKHLGGNLCPLHRLLDSAMESIETAFREMTIGELLENDQKGKAICDKKPSATSLKVDGKPKKKSTRSRRPASSSKKKKGKG